MINKYTIGTFIWAAGILLLTLTPGKSVPDYTLFSYDKLGHAFVFFVLAALLSKGLYQSNGKRNFAILITLLFTATYGMAIEIAQHFIPDRGMEWYDALANVVGSFLGVCLFYISNVVKA
ncbi:VanZ family protein [Fulvivirga sp. RKSG066]|uniref:VanZ family protein n=1 Tax=Fulvivirga aurantia TaxID=2529383 RepID=UPI0012BB6D9E|nr:VanZ family protein [Fulvivirga aurantia]MTI22498.1 VanZ family protein [Fulvivirga aurantia]